MSPSHPLTHPPNRQIPVIPVIDLMASAVVHAVGGNRERYLPIESPLVQGTDPLDIAQALAVRVGHKRLYLADLDAIGGGEPAWTVYRELLAAGFKLWLDGGIGSVERAAAVAELHAIGHSIHRVIVGLESLPHLATLAKLFAAVGPERFAFSLDLRAGRPLFAGPAIPQDPLAIVDEVVAIGVQQLIVIDLSAVGVGEGPPVIELCRQIRRRTPQLELIAGGGVRGVDDLVRLREAGCDAALASTWLHASR
jgi:phosphoribosylformimino-5-aminoimidazole carboxamide ribotide isomerase